MAERRRRERIDETKVVRVRAARLPAGAFQEDPAGELHGQVRAVGLPEPATEHRFHHERGWMFDFAWPDRRIAVEVDGGTWTGGRHVRGRGYEDDCRKLDEAAIAGWMVLRVTTAMVESGEALEFVERALGRSG